MDDTEATQKPTIDIGILGAAPPQLPASHAREIDSPPTSVRTRLIPTLLEYSFVPCALTVGLLFALGQENFVNSTDPVVMSTVFLWLFVVMLWGAFGVVHHAESLASILGEPFGTLVLTLSATSIEVSLLATIMLHGAQNPTLARDTMFAVLMIVLNGTVGLAVVLGALRYREQDYNLQGARSFIILIAPLSVLALVLPDYTRSTPDPTFSPVQAAIFSIIILSFYGIFLGVQTVRHRAFFEQPEGGLPPASSEGIARHAPSGSGLYHATFLLLTLVPMVMLAEMIATIADNAIEKLGAPAAIGGVFIAVLVLAPESATGIRAALNNQLQRAVNVCLGAALATIGLTVPAVLIIGLLTGTGIHLGLDNAEIAILALTLFLSALTFGGQRTNVLQGVVHLLLFVVYIALIFSP